MRILLLSAYDADSHQYWHRGLVNSFPEHQWQVLTLPGRYFSWRIRGNSMSWAFGPQASILNEQYDLIIATSMTDLSSLKGFIPSLAKTKTIVYFHENQFAYPSTSNTRDNVEPKILNLYTALAADRLVFNSQYNFDTFFIGASQLLKKLPDQIPANLIDQLKSKSVVIPVPLIYTNNLASPVLPDRKAHQPIKIVWAARWEYDKGPDRLLAIIKKLEKRNINYQLYIMGVQFRQIPSEFSQIKAEFSHRLAHFGYAESKEEYFQYLHKADIFLSTAVHEFQGISVLEAVNAKCLPVLPNRLVYPELFNKTYLYETSCNIIKEATSAVDLIEHFLEKINKNNAHVPTIDFSWYTLKPRYEQLINQVIKERPMNNAIHEDNTRKHKKTT